MHHMPTHFVLQLAYPHYLAAPTPQVLHSSPGLRQLLGVRKFSPQQLLELLRALQARSRLAELGVAWLQRTLLAVFSLLGVAGAAGADMGMAGVPAAGVLSRTQVSGSGTGCCCADTFACTSTQCCAVELYKAHSRKRVCSACLPHTAMELMG
jgi:hypothetical protein